MKKRGFTMIELLVAMSILVIAFGLVTYLYTRAARIRKVVVVHNEIQQVLSQMMETLTYGTDGEWGIIDASDVASDSTDSILHVENEADSMEARLDYEDEGTIKIGWGDFYTNQISLDPEGAITINSSMSSTPTVPISDFQYFDYRGNILAGDYTEATFVKISLWARSTDPSLENAPPVAVTTGVRLRNKPSF